MNELIIGLTALLVFAVIFHFSKNYMLSLFAFIVTALCLLNGSVSDGLVSVFADGIYGQITDPAKAAMVAFIALYCGYVGSMEYGGPIKGFTKYFAERGQKTKTSVQLRAWLTSVGAFFSDLGSPGIVGTLFREKYNEVKLSRERLGMLVNLTAVPVCSMIPLVGWGLFAVGIINNTVGVTGIEGTPINMYFRAIPFFCLSLLGIITPILMTKDTFIVGRLKEHDKEALENSEKYVSDRKKSEVVIDLAEEDGKGFSLALSLVVMFSVLFFFLGKFDQNLFTAEVYPFMISLAIAFVSASLAVMLLTWLRREKPFMKSFSLYTSMFKRTLSVTGIMVVSWVYFDVAWKTGIYQWLVDALSGWLPSVFALPLVFILAVILSSKTGSAWGTYAVVMPLGILLAPAVGLSVFAGIGATVSGSVYGDISAKNSHAMHYSAESAGVDPEEFRLTQQPYMYSMSVACILAYGLGALVDKWYVYMAIAVVSYVVLLIYQNRKVK